jgi:hypothetical protein
LFFFLFMASPVWAQDDPGSMGADRELIELAICLDNSGSMKPLIDAARLSLWNIVNDLTLLDPAPRLRIALLTYGGRSNGSQNGWVAVQTPLTEDLDLVSERLFEVTTGGGTEYVGRVLKTALEQLDWSQPEQDALKMIFIAGNEPADQDPQVDYRSMGFETHESDFVLHTIYCGQEQDPNADTWKELAELADGAFASINLRNATALIESPVDGEMARLSSELDRTYIAVGEQGASGLEVQGSQNENVEALGVAAAATRAETKAGALYSKEWDLVDTIESGRSSLAEIDESELPKNLRGMTYEEQEAYISELSLRREEIRKRILELAAQRRKYVAEQVKKRRLDEPHTFEETVRGAIKQQVEERGFEDDGP